jgi:glutaredoxin
MEMSIIGLCRRLLFTFALEHTTSLDPTMYQFKHQITLSFVICMIALTLCAPSTSHAQEQKVQCFMLELFYDSTDESSLAIKEAFANYGESHVGVKLYFRDVHENEKGQKRLNELQDYFNLKEAKLPAVYGLKTFETGIDSEQKLNDKVNRMLTLTAFVRNGCPHCRAAKAFFRKYGSRYPGLKIVYREVTTDRTANTDMRNVVARYRRSASSLPVIHYCNGLTIGYSTDRTTGARILKTLDYWSEGCVLEKKN